MNCHLKRKHSDKTQDLMKNRRTKSLFLNIFFQTKLKDLLGSIVALLKVHVLECNDSEVKPISYGFLWKMTGKQKNINDAVSSQVYWVGQHISWPSGWFFQTTIMTLITDTFHQTLLSSLGEQPCPHNFFLLTSIEFVDSPRVRHGRSVAKRYVAGTGIREIFGLPTKIVKLLDLWQKKWRMLMAVHAWSK